ncbi:unnamed protein product [Coffea canephora]|uniref:Protein IDA-LIKE 2 n=1 Tax=Coffea canephora TaxID=49390 RepID=A0A068UAW0_COFCA|nr:unnamed protein product [Coffea canephora]
MTHCRRPLIQLLWLVVLIFFSIIGHSQGSRSTNAFKLNPKSQNSGHFFNSLPKRFPIPASGPSRKHNEIGLQSWRYP